MFAAFGISPAKARAKALKTVTAQQDKKRAAAGKARKQFEPLTEEQFEAAVQAEVDRIIGQLPMQRISPEYNVPAAAEHFCQLSGKAFVRVQVYIKVPEQSKDKKGRIKMVGRYVPFVHGKDYSVKEVA